MAAPNSRTGFSQASRALRRLGFRPCRTEKAPHLQTAWKFVAVPLKKGLTDDTVTQEDVKACGDTLTELVRDAEKTHGNPTAPPYTPHSDTQAANVPPVSGLPLTQGAAQDKLDALNTLLAGNTAQIDPDTLKDAIRTHGGYMISEASETLQAKWVDMVKATEEALAEREKSVDEKIAQALRTVANTTVTFNKPGQDPIVVEGQHVQFGTLLRELSFGISCYLTGPAGSGKTTAALKVAEVLDRPVFLMRAVLDPFELLGFIDGGGTYRETPLYKWATTPGAILVMDEIDRSNPKAAIAINSAWNGVIPFPKETVEVPEGNLIIATANTWGMGTDAEYVGSCRLDGATLDRFPTRIVWGYDESLESKLSGNPAEAAWCQRLRKETDKRGLRIIFSPRTVIAHCKRLAGGVTREDSLAVSCLASLEPDVRADLIMEVGS